MGEGLLRRLKHFKARLATWAKMTKEKDAAFGALWSVQTSFGSTPNVFRLASTIDSQTDSAKNPSPLNDVMLKSRQA